MIVVAWGCARTACVGWQDVKLLEDMAALEDNVFQLLCRKEELLDKPAPRGDL